MSGFTAILKLDFKSAYDYNVMSIPLFIGIAFYGVFTLTDIAFNKNIIYQIEKQLAKKYMYIIYAIILTIATLLNNR